MIVLDISRIIFAEREAAIMDTELTPGDSGRPHLMEKMLRDRGYSQHGFWVAPGSRMTATKESASENEQ
jgi:hypothetical protein